MMNFRQTLFITLFAFFGDQTQAMGKITLPQGLFAYAQARFAASIKIHRSHKGSKKKKHRKSHQITKMEKKYRPTKTSTQLKKYKPVVYPQGLLEAQESYLIKAEDVERIIPTDMIPTSEANSVVMKIADKSLQYWADTIGKDSVLVRTAHSVEKKMKTGVVLQTGEQEEAIQHHINLNIKAFESMAQLEYKGWTQAQFSYSFREQKSQVKVSEKFLKNKELTLAQERNTIESIASVGIAWQW